MFCGGKGKVLRCEWKGMQHVRLPFCHLCPAKWCACLFGTVFVESFALARMQAGYESDEHS